MRGPAQLEFVEGSAVGRVLVRDPLCRSHALLLEELAHEFASSHEPSARMNAKELGVVCGRSSHSLPWRANHTEAGGCSSCREAARASLTSLMRLQKAAPNMPAVGEPLR